MDFHATLIKLHQRCVMLQTKKSCSTNKRLLVGLAALCILWTGAPTSSPRAANFSTSAHGNASSGVNRTEFTANGYSIGNCANCHEQHSSLDGNEPLPANGGPFGFCLFATNFNTAVSDYPYNETDSICFYCHYQSGSIMQVTNYTYAQTFGGFTPTTPIPDILTAFSLALKEGHTEHNLKDIYNYALAKFPFFTASSNPCNACHNPHLAKRNNLPANRRDPAQSAISRPTAHEQLWGDDDGSTGGTNETMSVYSQNGTIYQPPYYYQSQTTYEPDGAPLHDGSLTPDYPTFCLDCHGNADVYSTRYARNLHQINWGPTGDIHGGSPRYADNYTTTTGFHLRPPFDTTLGGTTPNYVLSCLDCHEPHGTILYNYGMNSFLVRKEVNGEVVNCISCGWITNDADWTAADLCRRCHQDASDGNAIAHCGGDTGCFNCHYHGSMPSAGCSGGPAGTWNKKAF